MDIDISFAEAVLRRGAGLLEAEAEAGEAGTDPFAVLARLLAAAAATDAPLVVLSEGGSHPALFDEANRRAVEPLTARLAGLAATRQGERATMYEFDGTGPLTGNRIVAALLRPEDRPDLLHVYIAVGRLRGGEAQITVPPALLRFDAAALGQTLGLLGDAVSRSANAATAALAHAAAILPMEGHEEGGMPAALLDLYWHALTLASVRTAGGAGEGLAGMTPEGNA